MINPNNKEIVDSLTTILKTLDRNSDQHNALIYDMIARLEEIRSSFGEDYPYCGTCHRPAHGTSKGCHECQTRHPDYYRKAYGE